MDDEVLQFKNDGYLVKRGVIDQDYCKTARERLWDDAPPSLSEDDPESWVGPFTHISTHNDVFNVLLIGKPIQSQMRLDETTMGLFAEFLPSGIKRFRSKIQPDRSGPDGIHPELGN
jgi:hypothetical protein